MKTTIQITIILEKRYKSRWDYDPCDKRWEGIIGGKQVYAYYKASKAVVQILNEGRVEVESFSVGKD